MADRSVDNAGDVFHQLISSLENSGAKYAVLYVSDPFNPIQYPSHQIGRFLAEASGKNVSGSSTMCDEVCQVKKTLLEGIFVVSIFFHHLNEAMTVWSAWSPRVFLFLHLFLTLFLSCTHDAGQFLILKLFVLMKNYAELKCLAIFTTP